MACEIYLKSFAYCLKNEKRGLVQNVCVIKNYFVITINKRKTNYKCPASENKSLKINLSINISIRENRNVLD